MLQFGRIMFGSHLLRRIIALCLIMGMWAGPSRAEHKAHVLVLHSYHKGLTWTDAISKGIETTFENSDAPVELEYEFMDTKRVFNQAYLDQLVELYRVKFKGRTFKAIICSDDHAFNFLLRHGKALFGNTPVVFCGINFFRDEMLSDAPNFTGVLESFDMLTTINTALALQPDADRLVAIGDQTVSGKANKKRLLEIIPRLDRPVEVTILDNQTMLEVQSYVGNLSPRDIVIWLVFTADRNGDFFSFEDSTHLISSHSNAPMYSFWDFNLGHGIVGGMLTSGVMQGRRAAEMALRIMHGEAVADIPIIRKSPNQYMFDYKQLERFDIKLSRLPPGSIVINQPQTFYAQHKQIVWIVFTVFCTMSTVILLLLYTIASKKRAASELMASKDRYQNVFTSTSVALLEVDLMNVRNETATLVSGENDGFRRYLDQHPEILPHLATLITIKDVNPAATALFKATDKYALMDALPRRLFPATSSTLKEIVIALAEKRGYFVWEDALQDLKGRSLHVIISMNFPRDASNYRDVVISVFDITDRKMSEEALRRSEDRFRTVFRQTASGMALMDLDGTYLRVNSALVQMLGYSESELLQRTWRDITHEEDLAISQSCLEKALQGNFNQPIEKRYLHKNGQVVHVLLNLAANFDENRQPIYLIAQFQNITQIKTAQAALRERDERYRQFFEADLSGVYIVRADGEVIMCNEVFARMLGFDTRDDVIGTNLIQYYKNPGRRRELVSQLIKDRRLEQYDLELVRRDGAAVQCLVNAVGHFDAHDHLVEIQGYLMDVTRTKSLEAQLLHAQKMESIGTMAGGVAHDFNNLLMGIMGNTSLLMMDGKKDPEELQRLKCIEQLVQSGSDLTRQLLGFAKGGKYEVRTTDLNWLILRSIKMFSRTHKEIQVSTALADQLKLVEADRSQIDQVLYNLYLNAWQAMENNGQLIVRTANRSLDEDSAAPYGLPPGPYVEIAVEDNGVGMDEDVQQRIFDPFFTTKERERGTGLGLASAYGIIQNHAGAIAVQSRPQQGACFTILLPASRHDHVEKSPEPSPELVKGTETILLVDDEEGVLDAVGSMLRHLGYTVLTAANGKTAIEAVQKDHDRIDLIILDMVMPGIGGEEVFEQVKAVDPDIKVLLSSGYTVTGQAAGILERDCQGFIQKPFTLNQLSQKLRDIFQDSAPRAN